MGICFLLKTGINLCWFGFQMVPEEADDLWLAYNLISKGDKVMAATVRYFFFFFRFFVLVVNFSEDVIFGSWVAKFGGGSKVCDFMSCMMFLFKDVIWG